MMRGLFAVGVAVLVLGGCGGGSSPPPMLPPPKFRPSPQATPVPAKSPSSAVVRFTIVVPARHKAQHLTHGKRPGRSIPDFVSPATKSVGISVNSGLAQYFNVDCNQSQCTIQVQINAPLGNDTFALTTWDGTVGPSGPNGSQNQLGQASTNATVVPGLTQVAITIDGLPVTATLSLSATSAPKPSATSDVTVNAQDADGYTITGTYGSPVTVAVSAPTPGVYPPSAFAITNSAVGSSAGPPAVLSLSGTSNGLTQFSAELDPLDNTGAQIGPGAYFTTTCTVNPICMYTAFDTIDTNQNLAFVFNLPGATADVASFGGKMWVAEGLRGATLDASGDITEFPPPGVFTGPPQAPSSLLALVSTPNGLYYSANDSVLPSEPVSIGVLTGSKFTEYPQTFGPTAMDVQSSGSAPVIWGEDGLFVYRIYGGGFRNELFFSLCSGDPPDEITTRIAGPTAFFSANFGADVAWVPAASTAQTKCIGSATGSIPGSAETPLVSGGQVGGMVVGPDGNVWVTDAVNGKFVRFATSGTIGTQTVFSPPPGFPGLGSAPAWEAVTNGPNGYFYFYDENNNIVGRFNPSTQTWAAYTAPVNFAAGLEPMTQNAIAFGPDGNLYISMPVPAGIEVVDTAAVAFDLRRHPQVIHPVRRPLLTGRHRRLPQRRYRKPIARPRA
jgi:hypothetical protein